MTVAGWSERHVTAPARAVLSVRLPAAAKRHTTSRCGCPNRFMKPALNTTMRGCDHATNGALDELRLPWWRGQQKVDRRTERPIRQLLLAVHRDVARQHARAPAVVDQQHAGAVVVRLRCGRRMHDAEPNAVPLPARAGAARAQLRRVLPPACRQAARARPSPRDRAVTADVIHVGVTEYDRVEHVSRIAPQVRHHDRGAEIETGRKSRTCVVTAADDARSRRSRSVLVRHRAR